MICNFDQMISLALRMKPIRLAVAMAADQGVLEAVSRSQKLGLIEPILIGDKNRIDSICEEYNLKIAGTIIDESDGKAACKAAVQIVSSERADALMKGLVDTSIMLSEVLNKEYGLYIGKILSHVVVFSVDTYPKLLYIADTAMNIAPDAVGKSKIINNTIEFCHGMGLGSPKVAILAAKESVDKKMQATLDAKHLVEWSKEGRITGGHIQGPLALDNAINKRAAELKGISGAVAGQADILIAPDIESGNILSKALTYFAKAKSAGIILGAKNPIVLTSRADSAEVKINSIAMAVIAKQASGKEV